jgi:hypothetical protein
LSTTEIKAKTAKPISAMRICGVRMPLALNSPPASKEAPDRGFDDQEEECGAEGCTDDDIHHFPDGTKQEAAGDT